MQNLKLTSKISADKTHDSEVYENICYKFENFNKIL